MATIKYFVPEDGDTEEHPNIFMLPKSSSSQNGGASSFSPKLRDVKDAFPMPGTYHFRFKSPLIPGTDREKGAVAVWMDCVDDNQRVGVWRNGIMAKVTRIGMDDDDDDDDDDDSFEELRNGTSNGYSNGATAAATHRPSQHAAHPQQQQQHASSSAAARVSSPQNQPTTNSDANLLFPSHPTTHSTNNTNPNTAASSGNLLDVVDPPPTDGATLLDMGTSTAPSSGNAASDFLGMTSAPVSAPVPASLSQQQQQQQQQYQAQQQNKAPTGNVFQKKGPFDGLY